MSLCDVGRKVFGVEITPEKLARLAEGNSPIEDILSSKLREHLSTGNYIPTNSFEVVADSATVIICVPTPLGDDRNPDLTYLKSAVSSIAEFVQDDTLLINESTSYVGTVREVICPIVQERQPKIKVHYASAPERIDPRNKTWNIKNTPRLVAGMDKESLERATRLYTSICSSVVPIEKIEIVEMAKLLENSFRLVNIALINDLAKVASSYGVDIEEVVDAASSKPYGFMPFHAGLGVGGHCIPVDPLYLTWSAKKVGLKSKLIEVADQINRKRTQEVANRVRKDFPTSVRIRVVGIAYKQGISDTRESPSVELIGLLREVGYEVTWTDGIVEKWNGEVSEVNKDFDLLIYVHGDLNFEIQELISDGKGIYDLSGKFRNILGVVRP